MPPLYGWECENCKISVELLKKFSESDVPPSNEDLTEDKKPVTCGEVEGTVHKWRRVIGPTSFKLIGYGWYSTDY